MDYKDGVDASGRKGKVRIYPLFSPDVFLPSDLNLRTFFNCFQGKGVYQFVDKYGANVDGYR